MPLDLFGSVPSNDIGSFHRTELMGLSLSSRTAITAIRARIAGWISPGRLPWVLHTLTMYSRRGASSNTGSATRLIGRDELRVDLFSQ